MLKIDRSSWVVEVATDFVGLALGSEDGETEVTAVGDGEESIVLSD
jgi:hypothetical protein